MATRAGLDASHASKSITVWREKEPSYKGNLNRICRGTFFIMADTARVVCLQYGPTELILSYFLGVLVTDLSVGSHFASHCSNERSIILRNKDNNSSQEKETSESEEHEKKRKEIEKSSEGLFEKEEEESRKNEEYLTTPLTSIAKKESLKRDCIGKYVVVYDYLSHLRKVFLVFRANSLFANSDKCTFCVDSVVSLGFIVNKNGVHVDPEKIKAI